MCSRLVPSSVYRGEHIQKRGGSARIDGFGAARQADAGTDAPFLAVPWGKRCEPAYVCGISEVAAETLGVTREALSEATCATASVFKGLGSRFIEKTA